MECLRRLILCKAWLKNKQGREWAGTNFGSQRLAAFPSRWFLSLFQGTNAAGGSFLRITAGMVSGAWPAISEFQGRGRALRMRRTVWRTSTGYRSRAISICPAGMGSPTGGCSRGGWSWDGGVDMRKVGGWTLKTWRAKDSEKERLFWFFQRCGGGIPKTFTCLISQTSGGGKSGRAGASGSGRTPPGRSRSGAFRTTPRERCWRGT